MHHSLLIVPPLLLWHCAVAVAAVRTSTTYKTCRCYPGDDCWPSVQDWASLNSTVSGRLVQIVPPGAPCHNPNFQNATCTALRTGINSPDT